MTEHARDLFTNEIIGPSAPIDLFTNDPITGEPKISRMPESARRAVAPFAAGGQTPFDTVPGITRSTKGLVTRPASVMGGATAGMALGVPGGPPGMLGGAILGATGGSILFDTVDDLTRYFRGDVTVQDRAGGGPQRALDITKRGLKEGLYEGAFTGGAMAAGPAIRQAKPLMGRAFGVLNPRARRLADLGEAQGVDLGLAHVSKRATVKGFPRVLGVFPFVGAKVKSGQARVVGQLDEAAADLLNTLAPDPINKMELGKELIKTAVRRFRRANRIGSSLYKVFERQADELPVPQIVPTANIGAAVQKIEAEAAKGTVTLTTGVPLKPLGQDQIGGWLEQFKNLPERVTVREAREMQRMVNETIDRFAKEGYDISRLNGLRGEIKSSIHNLDVTGNPPGAGFEVRQSLKRANDFWHKEATTPFQTPVAKKFGRAVKNVFGKRYFEAGSIHSDEVFKGVFNSGSIEALQDLRKLVGPTKFRQSVRAYIDDAFRNSRVISKEGSALPDQFSAAAFEKRLGLTTPEGKAAFDEMLRGSLVSPKDFYNFLDVAKAATDITVRDTAQMLQRRAILGGLGAGMIFYGGKVSIPAALFLTWMLQQGGGYLMNPRNLRQMTRVLKDSAPQQEARALTLRVIREMGALKDE